MIQTLYSTASSSSSMPLKSGNEAGTIFSRGGSHFEAGLSDGKDTKNKVYTYHTCKNLIPMVVTRAKANSSKKTCTLDV